MSLRRGFTTWALTCALAATAFASTALATTTNTVALPLCCIPSGPVKAIAIDGNTAYVGGSFTHLGLPRHHLAVLTPSNDQPQEGWPGVDGGYIRASTPDGSGGWYVAGDFTSIAGVARSGLAHIQSDKTVDPNWAPSTNGTVKAIARDTAGRVYVGGSFTQVNGSVARANLAAFDANGQATSFQADTDNTVDALATSFRDANPVSIGRLYVGGAFTSIQSATYHYFAEIDTGTGTVLGADAQLNGTVTTIGVAGGGPTQEAIAYIGGSFTGMANPSLATIRAAAFHEDGSAVTSFLPALDTAPSAIAPNGSVVYLGGVSTVGGHARSGLGAVDSSTGAVQTWAPVLQTAGGFLKPKVRSIVVSGGTIYVAGQFISANSVERNNLAAFDAAGANTAWNPDAPGYNVGVTDMRFDGSAMLVSGEFSEVGGPARNNLAAIDLSTGQVTNFDPGVDGEVDALAVQGGVLYVGGNFTHIDGGARNSGAAIDLGSGALTGWDPNLPFEQLEAIAPAGSTVFLGGLFTQVAGAQRSGLAEVDVQTGGVTQFKADLAGRSGAATALLYRNGTLYVGGSFTSIGGVQRNGFATVQNGAVTAFDPQFDNDTEALLLHGSTLYVGGAFSHVLTVARSYIAGFDAGGTLLPFNPGFDADPTALADDDSELFAVGPVISSVSGTPHQNAAAIDLATGNATPWAPALPTGTSLGAVGLSRATGVLVGGDAVAKSGQGVLALYAIAPSTPGAPAATAGDQRATVNFGAPPSGGSPIMQYTVTASPGGQTATGTASPITVPGLTNGTSYTFRLTATNAAGQSPTSVDSNAVTPTAAPVSPPGTQPGPGGGATLTASAFKVTHNRFAVAKQKTALTARKTPKGTTFTFKLSAAAVSRITIAQQLNGRRKGKRCVAPRRGLKRKCMRLKKVGTLTREHTKAGANRVPFSGRLGKRALRPGKYKATLVATDAAGHKSKPLALTFTVVKR